MTPTTTLSMVDGVRVVVPDSLELITPYVLQEQQDWFEDEIKFLRRLLQPGDQVVDIGANYGVYTLSMARAVGATGRVWAFEPASSTARLLAAGIAANGFPQVTLEQSALSSACGTAQLSLNPHAELNSLVRGHAPRGATETVAMTTLDECMRRHGWLNVEFMKIDAEGEEANILAGGRQFFQASSPLVQYEVVDGNSGRRDYSRDFAALGYETYRLVPGLGLLVRHVANEKLDSPGLNLFACKPGHARKLAARGFLADTAAHPPDHAITRAKELLETGSRSTSYGWRNSVAKLPYGMQIGERFEQTMASGRSAEVGRALALYAMSRDIALAPADRFAALESAFCLLDELCVRDPSYMRLSSVARVARDYGARPAAVAALKTLSDYILESNRVHTSEPFLAPGERFDAVPPGKSMGNWVLAAVLEELERLEHYSSFYAGPRARSRLEMIQALGFASEEMGRRLSLVRRRFS